MAHRIVGIEGMSTIERKTPQALRSRQRDWSASALRPDEALLLSLQQTAGNRAVSGLIQRVRANYEANDKRAKVVVDDGANPMTVTGSAKDETGAEVDLSGWLDYKQTEIPSKAVSSGSRKERKGALEINDLVAQPTGRRLGQLLAWHLARNARAQEIDYVVAGNVSSAREPFYVPLGFRDFKDAKKSWKSLDAKRAKLKKQIDAGGPGGVAQEVWDKYHKVRRAIAANMIFVSTKELEEEARTRWSQQWSSK